MPARDDTATIIVGEEKVTLKICGEIDDLKSGKTVDLKAVEITGTPLQVGIIFEVLNSMDNTKVDIQDTDEKNIEVLNKCHDALAQFRNLKGDKKALWTDKDGNALWTDKDGNALWTL